MTIQDWGAIGEVVGAIAVVVTLLYLATQIRHARLAAADASRQSRADGVREILLAHLTSPEYREAWDRASGPDFDPIWQRLAVRLDLTPEQASMVWNGGMSWAYLHWAQFRSMKTPADHRELENIVVTFYGAEPMKALWEDETFQAFLDPEFVAWVKEVRARNAS